MNVTEVDERSANWERHSPTFRVLHTTHAVTSAFDCADCDIDDVRRWAASLEATAGGRTQVGILLDDSHAGPGVVWLA